MFAKILAAVDDVRDGQGVLELVRKIAVPGSSEVHILHLRLRELSGYRWYSRESKDEASFVAEAAVFDLRMAGLAAGSVIRYAYVDRVAQAILDEAGEIGADLIVLGLSRRSELLTRLFGAPTLRVVRRSQCPVIVAPRRVGGPAQPSKAGLSAPGRQS